MELYRLDAILHRLVMAMTQEEVDELVKYVVYILKPDEETLNVFRRCTEIRRIDITQRQLDPELPDFDDYHSL